MKLHTSISLIQSLKTCLDKAGGNPKLADEIMRNIQSRKLDIPKPGLTEDEKNKIRNEIHELTTQIELLEWYAKQSGSPSYELLAEWFQSSDCKMEDKQLLAVFSLYESLKTQFSDQANLTSLIPLSSLHFDNPERFCAFLLWILESSNNAAAITDSGILHHFIQFHSPYLSVPTNQLNVVYHLLNQIDTPSVSQLLDYANNHYSGIRGLALNQKVPVNGATPAGFKSSNLSGGTFEHPTQLLLIEDPPPRMPSIMFSGSADSIVKFYRWFGIDMLTFIDVRQPAQRQVFKHLLASAEGDALRQKLPSHILISGIPVEKVKLWLEVIAEEAQESKRDIGALISTHPFYTYMLSYGSTTTLPLSPEVLQPSILALQQAVGKASVNETSVILWADLYQYLKRVSPASPSGTPDGNILAISEFILNQFSRFTSEPSDEVLSALRSMNISNQHIENRLKLFKQELITMDSGTFESLKDKWGDLRASVYNLLHVCPELRDSRYYPADIYALKAFYIEQVWRRWDKSLNVLEILQSMSSFDDELTQKRTVLEALLYTQEPALQDILINHLNNQHILWGNESFGDDMSMLEKAIRYDNPALLMRILSSSGDNMPNQKTVSDALNSAADAGKWVIVSQILNLTEDNKPNQEAVSAALNRAVYSDELSIVSQILDLIIKDNKPNQKAVSDALNVAASAGKLNIVTHILDLTKDNKPNQKAVSDALNAAASAGELNIVTHILNLTKDNKPNQKAVSDALNAAASAGKLNIVTHILDLTGDNKPNQEAVSAALKEAARAHNWDIITQILKLNEDNKPNQKAVSDALHSAVYSGKWVIVSQILNLTEDNKPNQEAVSAALKSAVDDRNWNIVTQILKLTVTGDNKLNEQAVSAALSVAGNFHKWDIVKQILKLTKDINPNQMALFDALNSAANDREWDIVKQILDLTGDNIPNELAVSAALSGAPRFDRWDIVKQILTKDINPNREAVSFALKEAANFHKWDIVEQILTKDINPNQEAVSAALKSAVDDRNWNIVTQILKLIEDNKPDQKAVSAALNIAAGYDNWGIVRQILNLTKDNKPDQKAVSAALNSAARAGELNIVIQILNLTKDNKPDQKAVYAALNCAAAAGKLTIVTQILKLTGDIKPNQEGVSAALKAAARFRKWDIVSHILTLTGDNKPNQDAVSFTLIAATEAGKLEVLTCIENFLKQDQDQSTTPDSLDSKFTP